MARIATRNVKPSSRPEPLGGSGQTQLERSISGPPDSLKGAPTFHRNRHGYGPPAGVPDDARPDTIGAHDAQQLLREEAFRAHELADLPDTGQPW